jgi:hypothetical protein
MLPRTPFENGTGYSTIQELLLVKVAHGVLAHRPFDHDQENRHGKYLADLAMR